MKPIYAVLLRRLFMSKQFWLFGIVMCAFAVRAVLLADHASEAGQSLGSVLLDLYYGVISEKWIPFLIIPLFLLLIAIISDLFDRYKILLKYDTTKRWWKEKVAGAGMYALISTLVINVVILGAIVFSGHAGEINGEFTGFLLLGMVMQVIGFLIVAVFYFLLVLLFSHQYVGLIVTIAAVLFVSFLKGVLHLNINTLQEYMTLTYKWSAGQIAVNYGDLVPVMALALACVVLYYSGSALSQDKDFYWSE